MILHTLHCRHFVSFVVLITVPPKSCAGSLWTVGIFSDFVHLLGVKNPYTSVGPIICGTCLCDWFPVFDEVSYYILVEISQGPIFIPGSMNFKVITFVRNLYT